MGEAITSTDEAPSPPAGLRIALLGSRGIPARYGGYETLYEEIGPRLVERGHEVTVYCRSHYTRADERAFHGVRLERLPTLRHKYTDTPVHTLLSALHVLGTRLRGRRFDAALVVNSANALFVPLLRLAGVPTALHVDGIEKRRAKWGPVGRWVYALSERLACVLPNVLVTDARVIEEHYRRRYGASSWMITYGAEPRPPEASDHLETLGLEAGRYFLYVSRFEKENNPHRVVAAYADVPGDLPLVMVGGAPYASEFIRSFASTSDRRVVFPGAIYGDAYRALQQGALAYVQATEVGGTHPALVEAMAYGNCVLVNDTPENREVAGDEALYFRAEDAASLSRAFRSVLDDPEEARRRGAAIAERALERFSWRAVTTRYEDLFRHLAGLAGNGG